MPPKVKTGVFMLTIGLFTLSGKTPHEINTRQVYLLETCINKHQIHFPLANDGLKISSSHFTNRNISKCVRYIFRPRVAYKSIFEVGL